MLSIDEMQAELRKLPKRHRNTTTLPLNQALGYHLAEDIVAAIDTPPFANSAMDGFAVCHRDISKETLPISLRIAAGDKPMRLPRGTAARIFTGAPMPEGADTVVIQEDCDYSDDTVRLLDVNIKLGENVRRCGEDLAKGTLISTVGQILDAPLIGVLASQGIATVNVFSPLSVALVSTGNELTPVGEPLPAGGIYDSNQHMISALLNTWGKVNCQHLRLPDDLAATKIALKTLAKDVDLIITFGGVSVGEEDHIKQAVRAIGDVQTWKVKLKPGKPLMLGVVENPDSPEHRSTPILGLPGNPISALVTFLLFGRVLLDHLSFREARNPMSFRMPLGFAITSPNKRPELVRVKLQNGQLIKNGNQSSGALASLIGCDGLALLPSDICLEQGDTVEFYPMTALLHG